MNKKNLIIVVALLLISNTITYLAFATNKVELSKDTGTQELAKVDGKAFTADDIYNKWVENASQVSTLDVLLQEVDATILEKKYGENPDVDVKTEEQIAQAEAYYESQGSTLDEQFEQIPNLTREQWEDSIRVDVMNQMAAVDYVKTVVSEDEIKKAYDEDKPLAKTSHILISSQPKEGETAQDAESRAESKAVEVLAELDKNVADGKDVNETFANLAKEYSDDNSSKDKGGDIGFSNSEDQAYQDVVNKLEVGEYSSEVVKTAYGYSIILKTDVQEKPAFDAEGVQDKYRTQVADQKISEFPTYSQFAIIKLREENSFKINDTALNDSYNTIVEQTTTAVENFEDTEE